MGADAPVPLRDRQRHGAVASVLDLDQRVSSLLAQAARDRRGIYWTSAILAHSGDGLVWIVLIGGAILLGPDRLRADIIRILVGMLISAGLVAAIKLLVRRERPYGELSTDWTALASYDRHSFPSGHSARVVYLAVSLAALFPSVGAVAAVWAIAVSLARVAVGAHFLSDVIAGAVVGLAVALALPVS